MALKMKRSAVAGKVPTTVQLDLGELAVNTYDGKLYLKRDNGSEEILALARTIDLLTLASKADAEAGSNNAKYMTPLRVKEAIDALMPKGYENLELFTASGTWTKPAGVTQVGLIVIAGGGGGSGYNSGNTFQDGGLGGLGVSLAHAVTGNVSVTVGAGGNGCPGSTGSGSTGGSSAFGSITATGGQGGIGTSTNQPPVNGSCSGADVNTVVSNNIPLFTAFGSVISDCLQLLSQSLSKDGNGNSGMAYAPGGNFMPGAGGDNGNYNQGGSADGGVGGAVFVFY